MRQNTAAPCEDPNYIAQRVNQLVYARYPLFYRSVHPFTGEIAWHNPAMPISGAQNFQPFAPPPAYAPSVAYHKPIRNDFWVCRGASLHISNMSPMPFEQTNGCSAAIRNLPPHNIEPLLPAEPRSPAPGFVRVNKQLTTLQPQLIAEATPKAETSIPTLFNSITTQDELRVLPPLQSPQMSPSNASKHSVAVLCRLISKLCCFENIDESDLALNDHESSFLRMFIARKFKVDFDVQRLKTDPRGMRNDLVELFRSNRNKRLEEQIKMVYKRCIKYLKRNFKRKIRSISYKKYLDLAFYNHYFGEVAKEEDLPIERFFTPGSKSQFFKVKANFTYDFLEHTKKSKLFVSDVDEYLEKSFEQQFSKDNRQKIKKLCNDWKARLEESTVDPGLLAEELRTNMKIKLPWTLGEMRNATLNFRSILLA